MSAADQTTEQSTATTVGTPQLELYETAMCCETGVCGPSVDEQLLNVREELRWAQAQGASVARHNLTSDPDAFVANPKVTGLMQAFGDQALPVLVIDGEITSYGHYPSRDELVAALTATSAAATEPIPEAKSSGCCSPDTRC
ncbi:MAG TPA: arsenite efflux transporter metallochaperone ArsD [Solirubrobacteraceae bacterium]